MVELQSLQRPTMEKCLCVHKTIVSERILEPFIYDCPTRLISAEEHTILGTEQNYATIICGGSHPSSTFTLLHTALSTVVAGHCIHADCSLISHAPFLPFLLSLAPAHINCWGGQQEQRFSLTGCQVKLFPQRAYHRVGNL